MNWAAWTLVVYTIIGLVVGLYRLAAGRKYQEPATGGVAVLATILITAFTAGYIWLIVLAATL